MNRLDQSARLAADYFGVKDNISISYGPVMPGFDGMTNGHTVVIGYWMKNAADLPFATLVCHEVRHAWQAENGVTLDNASLPYRQRPHEIDAYAKQAACGKAVLAKIGKPPAQTVQQPEPIATATPRMEAASNGTAIIIVTALLAAVWMAYRDPATRQQRLQATSLFLREYGPLIISLALLATIMDGVQGNMTAQWLLAVILCQPLSGWVANAATRSTDGELA